MHIPMASSTCILRTYPLCFLAADSRIYLHETKTSIYLRILHVLPKIIPKILDAFVFVWLGPLIAAEVR